MTESVQVEQAIRQIAAFAKYRTAQIRNVKT